LGRKRIPPEKYRQTQHAFIPDHSHFGGSAILHGREDRSHSADGKIDVGDGLVGFINDAVHFTI
jgi:hypothetical protein